MNSARSTEASRTRAPCAAIDDQGFFLVDWHPQSRRCGATAIAQRDWERTSSPITAT